MLVQKTSLHSGRGTERPEEYHPQAAHLHSIVPQLRMLHARHSAFRIVAEGDAVPTCEEHHARRDWLQIGTTVWYRPQSPLTGETAPNQPQDRAEIGSSHSLCLYATGKQAVDRPEPQHRRYLVRLLRSCVQTPLLVRRASSRAVPHSLCLQSSNSTAGQRSRSTIARHLLIALESAGQPELPTQVSAG